VGYQLGVDLGTTFTAAAVVRDGRSEVVTLGTRALQVPSVVYLRDDGQLLTGEAAERRSATEPERIAREFKRRMGDPTPILIGGTPFSAHTLMSKLLRGAVDVVTAREGSPPDSLVVTRPANWGEYKRELLEQAVQQADVGQARTVIEPEAAAVFYASTTRVAPGETVAIYDLGGGTFDATVLRKTETGFTVLGEPMGIEQLGGVDFDEAVFGYVTAKLGDGLRTLDPNDPATLAALARLRRDCVEAKEALSSDTDASIVVALPTVRTEVRLVRTEFEDLIRPALLETIETMRRALRAADVEPEELKAIVLVGGSSRIPLVAQLLTDEFHRPIAIDVHPKHAVAVGAAQIASVGDDVGAAAPADAAPASAADAAPASVTETPGPPPVARRRRGVVIGAAVGGVVVMAAVVGGLALASSGDNAPPPDDENGETAPPATGEPSVRWTFDTGGRISAAPVLDDGRVYVGTQVSDRIVALDADSGELAWEFETEGSVFGAAAVGEDGTIYVGSYVGAPQGGPDTDGDGFVYALDGETGESLWQYPVGAAVQSSPLVADGIVYFGADDGNLHAVDTATGAPAWTFSTGGVVRSSPAIEGGVLFFGSNDGNLYAVDAASQQERWRAPTGQADYSSPTVADGVVYIGSGGGVVSAVDAQSGELVWSFPTGGTVGCRPAVANGSVHFGSFDGKVYAVDTDGGGERWRFEVQPEEEVVLFSSPTVVDGIVYIGSHARKVWAIDDATGQEVWQFETDGIVGSSPLVSDGVLYVGSDDGNVYALDLPE
jgi:outer membrane protein assembly factor BamB/actin-like ATPase involved in cell morphogenesis